MDNNLGRVARVVRADPRSAAAIGPRQAQRSARHCSAHLRVKTLQRLQLLLLARSQLEGRRLESSGRRRVSIVEVGDVLLLRLRLRLSVGRGVAAKQVGASRPMDLFLLLLLLLLLAGRWLWLRQPDAHRLEQILQLGQLHQIHFGRRPVTSVLVDVGCMMR